MSLAVIPARGGSRRIHRKNIKKFCGKPIIAWTIDAALKSDCFDRIIVSTEDPEIAEVARGSGLQVPFFRPKKLSGDLISDFDVLIHALTEMERIDNMRYDVVVALQPTSPLRKASHVTSALSMLVDEEWDSVWTVSQTDSKYHPLKQLKLSHDGMLDFYDPSGDKIIARQQLETVYHRNGAAYVFTRECLLGQKTIKGKRAAAVVLNEQMISIDTLGDFEEVERLLSH